MRPWLPLLLGALATPAAAQEAVPCDWAARADGIVSLRRSRIALRSMMSRFSISF